MLNLTQVQNVLAPKLREELETKVDFWTINHLKKLINFKESTRFQEITKLKTALKTIEDISGSVEFCCTVFNDIELLILTAENGLDIPKLINAYPEIKVQQLLDLLKTDKLPEILLSSSVPDFKYTTVSESNANGQENTETTYFEFNLTKDKIVRVVD